jgi:hypothetical protein
MQTSPNFFSQSFSIVAGDENFLVVMNQIFTKQQQESNNYSKKETK